jgi:hypothetical protein
VADARVVAEVVEEGRGEKIVTFKKKRRNHYQMTMDEVQSYTVLRIREIAVGTDVYTAAAPRGSVAAMVTPFPSPPRISRPEPEVPEPQTEEPQAEEPQQASASPPPAAIEPTPQVASEELVGTQPPVLSVESPPPAPSLTETPPAHVTPLPRVEAEPRKRHYGIAALVVAVLVIVAGLLVLGGRPPQEAAGVAAIAAPSQAAPAPVPQPAAKAPARKETAIRNPVAASAPSAPVQPPE